MRRLSYSAAGLVRDAVLRGCGIGCLPDIAVEDEKGKLRWCSSFLNGRSRHGIFMRFFRP